MPETETAADQPTAGSTGEVETSSSDPYVPSFLRDEEPAPEAEEAPETQTAEGEGESEAESEASAEPGETTETGETESTSQDDFLASLTPEETAYYAKRYPTLYKAYSDPNQPADLRQAFVDRVNQDHAYAELRDGQQEEEEAEEPTQEAPPTNATEQKKQYYAQIDDIVAHQIDPQAVNEMGSQLLAAMGVDLASKDPEIQAIVKNAPKVGQVLARGAVDLMATTMPNLLASRLEMVLPGITRMYYRGMYGEVWEETRSKSIKGPDGKPTTPYSKLPGYGTPQFQQAVDKAMAEFPGLEEMTYRDKQGNVLPPREQAARKYALLAKMMNREYVSPAMVAQAVETGKKLARNADTRRAAGKVLGAGKPAGEVRPGGSGNEDIFGPGVEEYKRRGG